jgi:hypothetical protein
VALRGLKGKVETLPRTGNQPFGKKGSQRSGGKVHVRKGKWLVQINMILDATRVNTGRFY